MIAQTTPRRTDDELTPIERAVVAAFVAQNRPRLVSHAEWPRLTAQRWKVRDGQRDYTVAVTAGPNGVTVTCACHEGAHARPCWHQRIVQECVAGEMPFDRCLPTEPAAVPSAALLCGRPEGGAR